MNLAREFTLMVRPEWLNTNDHLHGAQYVQICDELAGVTADWYYPTHFVTGTIHDFRYLVPAKARDILRVTGRVLYAHGRVVAVETLMYLRRRYEREEVLCASGYFLMVAMQAPGEHIVVPDYWPEGGEALATARRLQDAHRHFREGDER